MSELPEVIGAPFEAIRGLESPLRLPTIVLVLHEFDHA
jgi:hypothetical protein